MADHPSLADRAVHALAEVAAMDRDVRSNDPECLVVWNLKDEAQQILAEAFTRAARLACSGPGGAPRHAPAIEMRSGRR